jgi:tetratricopeptide (TPR) repeat protein
MKNRLLLLSVIATFILSAGAYVLTGIPADDGSNISASEYFSGTHPKSGSGSSSPSVAPSAKNVSSSYYQQTEQLETYLANNPTDTTHILRLARLYQDGHQSDRAIVWYNRLIELQPRNQQIYLDLINSYGMASRWPDALKTTETLLAFAPGNEEAIYNKAAILANQGKFMEAKKLWSDLLRQTETPKIKDMTSKALAMLPNN